jgi:hypothetical protein
MMARVRVATALGGVLLAGCGVELDGLSLGSPPDGSGSASPPNEDASLVDASIPADDQGSPDVIVSSDDEGSSDAAYPGDDQGSSSVDASPGIDATADADSSVADAGPCSDATSQGCIVVPNGWTLVAFAPSQSSSCPTGFGGGQSDLVEGPTASGTCGCGSCSVTSQPSCNAGSIAVTYDTQGTTTPPMCQLTAHPSPLANTPAGQCGTDLFVGDYSTFDVAYAAPPASGGACTAPGVATGVGVTATSQDRTCAPDSAQSANCAGGVCQPSVSSPYAACLEAPGHVACPPGPMSVQHVVGTSATATCSACGCAITAKCSGTMTLFNDGSCKNSAASIATGVCTPIVSTGTLIVRSYEYQGAAPRTVGCQTGAPGSAQATLNGQETICCAP